MSYQFPDGRKSKSGCVRPSLLSILIRDRSMPVGAGAEAGRRNGEKADSNPLGHQPRRSRLPENPGLWEGQKFTFRHYFIRHLITNVRLFFWLDGP